MIYYGLLLFFIVEYIRPGTIVPGLNALRLNTLVPLGVVVGTMITASPVSNAAVFAETNTKLIGALIAMIFLSVLRAELTMNAVDVFTMVFGYVLIYWVLTKQLTSIGKVKGVFAMLILVHLFLAAITPEMFLDPANRHYIASGTFLGDGNDFALSVDLTIPMCLFLMTDAKRWIYKLFWMAALGILIFTVIASQSRGGTIGLVFMGVYYWMKTKNKIVTGGLAIVAIVCVMALAPPAYFKRMDTLAAVSEDGSAQGRISAWTAAFRMAIYNPLGVGAGQFPSNYTRYSPEPQTHWMTAHSIYFLILGELGFLGLFTLLGLIISNLVVNGRVSRIIKARAGPGSARGLALLASLSASMLAFAVAGAFLSAIYYPHMYVLAGCIVATRRILLEQETPVAVTETAVAPVPRVFYNPALRRSSLDRSAS
jgi:putative inorganic carbon (HCO3(-)) transporter